MQEEAGSVVNAQIENAESEDLKIQNQINEENELELEQQEEDLSFRRANMNFDDEAALLETVLFLESEPQPVETLSKITQMSADVVLECIEHLKDKY